ncbi:MAG: molybdopterin converting factor subunit 1 [Pseudomonadota bacterium]
MASVKLLYFAWVREKVGRGDETFDLPAAVVSVADLINWLRLQGPEYESAFENDSAIRVAINQEHVTHETPIAEAKEIAFFPPVTGG